MSYDVIVVGGGNAAFAAAASFRTRRRMFEGHVPVRASRMPRMA